MKAKRKAVSIMVTLSMLLVLLVPLAAPAGAAASNNYAVTVPNVKADDGQTLGVLAIKESDQQFREGDIITVELPNGVEYAGKPTEAAADDYYLGPADFVTASSRSITVKINDEAQNILYFYYGEDEDGDALASVVDIDGDMTGEIKVEIDAAGATITSGVVRIARITAGGDTTTTIASVETIAIDATNEIETIKIKESTSEVIVPNGGDIVLELPKDFEWALSGDVKVSGTGGLNVTPADLTVNPNDPKRLLIDVSNSDETRGQAGFITISGLQIMVPADAFEGDVEMNVDGNEVTEEDIIVAKVGDFGFKIGVSGSVPTIVAGKADQEAADFYIDDIVPGAWIEDRSVKLTLPGWAEWTEEGFDDDISELYNGIIDKDDPEIANYTVDGKNGKAEFKGFTVTIDADAPAGDLVVKFSGNAGVKGDLVIAKIVKPFTVATAATPEVFIGLQNQAVGDITITETQYKAIDKNKWIILRAPAGFNFKDDYDIEATELEIDNDEVDGRYLAFEVTGESNKEAGEIKISNITFDIDRSIPVGDITFEVFMTDNDALDKLAPLEFDEAINKDNYEEVADVVVGSVMNPAPGEDTVTETKFTVGSTTYVVNGVEKTADAAPYISGDRTFFAVRFVANALGVPDANITWNPIDQSVLITKGERILKLVIGSTTMLVNGVPVIMDVAPQIIEPGRTMLPVRWVAEALGATVTWDAATQTATLTIN
ncbi:MAG: copper amine oxidase N-terminal domain-containing protein [Desulfotomaculaceae bacterium]|nr:copper amine oxidase N-terminal domain-containing protein [Desulfotomaculaceae bacterium]